MIEEEVKNFVEAAHQRAKDILETHIDDLHMLAKALLEYETLSGDEIKALLRGEAINPGGGKGDDQPTAKTSTVPIAGKSRRPKAGPATGSEPEPQPGG
jgi:cell division protease FtsH